MPILPSIKTDFYTASLLRILAFHVGRANAVPRAELLCSMPGVRLNDRSLRLLIRDLRRQGHLIGSAPGEDGGYYLISDPVDFQNFMQQEYMALIADMSETAAAMRRAAEKKFGASSINQPALL